MPRGSAMQAIASSVYAIGDVRDKSPIMSNQTQRLSPGQSSGK